jgi:LacI family transcriptional regulator
MRGRRAVVRPRQSKEAAAMVTGQGPVTITDVARLAGVSPGTASKALNGRAGISAGTAIWVQKAAEQLGYQPNALARGLLTGGASPSG